MHVADRLLPGGIASYVFYLLSGLDRARWRPIASVLMEYEPGCAPFQEHSVPVVSPGMTRTSGLVNLVRAVAGISRLIGQYRPVVVHTHFPRAGYYGRIAAALRHVPVIAHTVHGIEPMNAGLRRKEHRVLRFTDRVVAVSEDTRRHLISEGYTPDKIAVIHSGAPPDVFAPNDVARREVRRELGISDEELLVGCVARLEPEKNVGAFVDAAALAVKRFPNLRFVIAGEGSEMEDLQRRSDIAELQGKLSLLGYAEQVSRLLCGMDVFVLPSVREGLGLALVEAMLTGVPVIGTRVGGVPEVIINGTGLLADSSAGTDIAACIVQLAGDRQLRIKLGQAGRTRAMSEFSSKVFVERMEHLYTDVLERKDCLVDEGTLR
ncbi:MAG: glycosyltransferase [Armatimonadota bacterium]